MEQRRIVCAQCGEEQLSWAGWISVEEECPPPLEFCSWECLVKYGVIKLNQSVPTIKQ